MDLSTKFHKTDICDNEGNLLASGYLWNDNGDYIEIRGKNFPILQEGEKIKVIAHHRNARAEIYTTFVYVSRENYLSLYVISKTIESNQRKFYRIKTNIKTMLNYEIRQRQEIKLEKPIRVCILDLSLGGIRMGSKTVLEMNSRYRIKLDLGKEIAGFVIKIIRRMDSEVWGNEYGCVIKDITPENEKKICQYIFDRERQQKAKINNILKKSIFIQ
jgi:c-di-GMP-binding flagellar brake protein YcgR